MKKIMFVFSALLLVCAGMVMFNCTSEAKGTEEPVTEKITPSGENPDTADIEKEELVFKGGKYQYLFDTPKIEKGKEYEVFLVIESCDNTFIGSHLGGKLCYKMDLDSDDETILSGWLNSVPNTVSKTISSYKWTFKAGQKNSDGMAVSPDAETPAGGKQYFAFTAQDGWKDYKAGDNFTITGGFKVQAVETITNWVSAGTLTLGNDNNTAGKGELGATEVAKIKAMPAKSKIVLTINVPVNDGDAKPGNGVAKIGPDWSSGINITIPGDAISGQTIDFNVDIKISTLLSLITNSIVLNVYNGATVTKAELFKPGT